MGQSAWLDTSYGKIVQDTEHYVNVRIVLSEIRG